MSHKFGTRWRSAFGAAGGLGGVLTALGGFGGHKEKEKDSRKNEDAKSGAMGNLLTLALQVAALIFVVVFLTGLSVLTDWLLTASRLVLVDWKDHHDVLENTSVTTCLMMAAAFLGETLSPLRWAGGALVLAAAAVLARATATQARERVADTR